MAVAGAGTHPAFFRHDHRHGFVHHLDFGHGFFLFLDQRAAGVSKGLGIGFDFLDHQAAQRSGAAQNFFELALLTAQLTQLLLDLDGLQAGQLAQSNFQDVFGLAIGELEGFNQRRFGFVALANDADDFVDLEKHQLTAFQNMNAVEHFVQAVLAAAHDSGLAETDPLDQHLAQRLLNRLAVDANRGHVDRRRRLQAGVRQQRGDEFLLLYSAGLGFKHQAHSGVFAGLVAHHIEHIQDARLELHLICAERFFTGFDLGVGELFNFFEHALRADALRQFGHHQLPLATGQVFYLPACTHFE